MMMLIQKGSLGYLARYANICDFNSYILKLLYFLIADIHFFFHN